MGGLIRVLVGKKKGGSHRGTPWLSSRNGTSAIFGRKEEIRPLISGLGVLAPLD